MNFIARLFPLVQLLYAVDQWFLSFSERDPKSSLSQQKLATKALKSSVSQNIFETTKNQPILFATHLVANKICVECPQCSIRLEALGYQCDSLSERVQR